MYFQLDCVVYSVRGRDFVYGFNLYGLGRLVAASVFLSTMLAGIWTIVCQSLFNQSARMA